MLTSQNVSESALTPLPLGQDRRSVQKMQNFSGKGAVRISPKSLPSKEKTRAWLGGEAPNLKRWTAREMFFLWVANQEKTDCLPTE